MFHNNTKRFMLKSSVIQTHLTWPTLRNGKFKRTDKWNFSMKLKGTRVFPKLLSSEGKNRGKKKRVEDAIEEQMNSKHPQICIPSFSFNSVMKYHNKCRKQKQNNME